MRTTGDRQPFDWVDPIAYHDAMREVADAERLRELMRQLGARAKGPGRIYLTGGSTAILTGWRDTTKDVDMKLDPEPQGVFEAIRDLKDDLDINIELAAPDQFLPPLPGWRQRSIHIITEGQVEFYHYDPRAQALAKISRGHSQDLDDVRAMHALGMFEGKELKESLDAIEPLLIRYPALDADVLRMKVAAIVEDLSKETHD